MNFYKHHLGDYAAATVHLSWDEDCAYRRLLDAYYKREAPIPVDVKEAARLVRATTPAQRRAVESVLREFFDLRDDGWHQKRCDEELAAANAQAETNRRIAEEREARRRARIDNGPSDDPPTNRATNRSPVSMVEREPSQTPDSRHQTPDLGRAENSQAGVARAPSEPERQPSRAGAACLAMRRAGLQAVNPGDPRLLALLDQGATDAELASMAAEAVSKGKGWAWVLAAVQGRRAEAAAIHLAPPVGATVSSTEADRTAAHLAEERARLADPEARAKAEAARKAANERLEAAGVIRRRTA